jgi:hypothetical protein
MPTPTNVPPSRGMRFPLSVKILLWFFLNLAFLGAAGWLAVHGQLRLGLDSLLAGPVNDRLQAMAAVVAQQLNERPRGRWEQILLNSGNAYHVQMAVFRNDGGRLAGQLELPEQVADRLREIRPGRRPVDEPAGGPPPIAGTGGGPPPADAPERNGASPPSGERPPPRPPPLAIQGAFPKTLLHTNTPSL